MNSVHWGLSTGQFPFYTEITFGEEVTFPLVPFLSQDKGKPMPAEETAKKQPLLSPILRWFMLAMVLANIAG